MEKVKYSRPELKDFLWDHIDTVVKLIGLEQDGNHYLCPFHGEDTGSFSISKDKKIMKCFGCGKTILDPYMLIKQVKGLDDKGTKKLIENIFNIKVDTKSDLVEEIIEFSRNGLFGEDGIEAREYLKTRGINLEAISNYPIGVLKSAFDVKSSRKTLPVEFHKATSSLSPDSLVFGILDVEDHSSIRTLKFRDWKQEQFSGQKSIIYYPKNSKKGLFGPVVKTDNIVGIITEGEIDALAVKSEFYKEDLNFDVFATGGQPSKEMFAKTPFSVIYYIPDHWDKNGDEIAIQFLKSLPDIFQGDVYVFDWEKYPDAGEDPADAVVNGKGKVFIKFENYIPADEYLEKAINRLEGFNKEDDLEILKIIQKIPIRISKQFLKRIDKEYLLSQAINIKDEDLYIEEIKKGIFQKFRPLYVTTDKRTPELQMLYKDPDTGVSELVVVGLTDPPKVDNMVPYLGKDIPSWMQDNFPTPEFLLYGANSKEVSFTERDKRLKAIFNKAIFRIANETPKRNDLDIISDGIHYIDGTLVIVNGKKNAFYFDLDEKRWKEITNNQFGDTIILGEKEFAPNLTVHQLNSPKDIKKVYKRTKKLLKKVFKLNHEWKYKIITAFIFYAIIHQVTKQKTFIWLNAEKGSGKTSLLKLLSLTEEGIHYRLIEPSYYFSNVTEAGLRRDTRNKAITVFMDEFERNQYLPVFNLLRQATGEGIIIRASRDSDTKTTKFKVSFAGVLGSITLSPNPADISRVIIISLHSIDKKKIKSFDSVCKKAAPYEYYMELSRDILVSSVNIFREYLEIRDQLEDDNPYFGMEPRSKANYINLHTILRIVGDEFTEEELKELKKAHFTENIEEEQEMHEIIEEYLLYMYKIVLNSGKHVSLHAILKSPSLIEEFNNMHYALKVDPEKKELHIFYKHIEWHLIDKELNANTAKNYLAKSPLFKGLKKSRIILDISEYMTEVKRGNNF